MESAEQLGYEVRVYARVPDTGDGQDRRQHATQNGELRKSYNNTKRLSTNGGGGATSTESETSASASVSTQGFTRNLGAPAQLPPAKPLVSQLPSKATTTATTTAIPAHAIAIAPPPSSITTQSSSSSATGTSSTSTRVRYREQGVDELLQLKLHQAIADADDPPENATIVLATGDGRAGQFCEDGFLGPVRTALKKGWRVELYAWEEGLSRAWMREFGEGPYRDRFMIVGLEQFGQDLMEV